MSPALPIHLPQHGFSQYAQLLSAIINGGMYMHIIRKLMYAMMPHTLRACNRDVACDVLRLVACKMHCLRVNMARQILEMALHVTKLHARTAVSVTTLLALAEPSANA